MRYLPITDQERKEMLAKIGVNTIDDLFACVPADVQLQKKLDLPNAKSEMEIERHMQKLGNKNSGTSMPSFLGGGCYNHYSPAIIDQMLLRSEFFTAYTPYQPEVSQGTLQAIFEFQTMVTDLLQMDVSNASMYDGATAAAEAALMAKKINKKRTKIVLASTLHPHYIETIKTYVEYFIDEVEMLDMDVNTGRVKESELDKIDNNTIGVIFQYPNYFGVIEDIHTISQKTKSVKALTIPVVTEATALGVVATPGDIDADIAVGEGQALGIPLNFGGPGVGLFTAKEKHVRKMPGRLVGKTVDKKGDDCFVLTLAAREQHIKREKATSNICTNQGLMALAAGMYMAVMGKEGLKEIALMNIKRADYLKNKISSETSAKIAFSGPVYNEFTILVPGNAEEIAQKMNKEGILGGIPASRYYPEMDNALIVATTELHTYEELDYYVETLKKVTGGAQ